jgi:hypothetical protein
MRRRSATALTNRTTCLGSRSTGQLCTYARGQQVLRLLPPVIRAAACAGSDQHDGDGDVRPSSALPGRDGNGQCRWNIGIADRGGTPGGGRGRTNGRILQRSASVVSARRQ